MRLSSITVSTEHLPSKLNIIADRESREKIDFSEWKLNPKCVSRVSGVSRASSINGEPSSRFACISTKSSITPVHSLEAGSIQSGHRFDAPGLVSGLHVCLPPLLPYKQNFTEGRARKSAKHTGTRNPGIHPFFKCQ